jgi:hypothetical protein
MRKNERQVYGNKDGSTLTIQLRTLKDGQVRTSVMLRKENAKPERGCVQTWDSHAKALETYSALKRQAAEKGWQAVVRTPRQAFDELPYASAPKHVKKSA